MQIFNQFNARLLQEGEFNVFRGILSNPLFLGVSVLTVIIQMAMVEYGGEAVKTYPLTSQQNALCLLIASGELLWGVLIKLIPANYFEIISLDEAEEEI